MYECVSYTPLLVDAYNVAVVVVATHSYDQYKKYDFFKSY